MEPKLDGQFIIDEINTVCNSLGTVDENDGTYMKDRDCKPCLREMLRYLNADSDKHEARGQLGALNVIKADLIPLIVQYCDYNEGDPELFTMILRLLTNLTSPALLLFENQQVPTEPEGFKLYNHLLNNLYGYKAAFASDDKIWSTLNVHLRHNTEDEITFGRLIILIRNILHIPVDSTSDLGVHADFDVHEMCLYRMDKSGMLNTIIEIASESQKGIEFCFHITEIIYLMLRDQNPETLAQAKPNAYRRRLDHADADKKRLAELSARNRRERDRAKLSNVMVHRSKHSLFVIQNCRTASGAPLPVRNIISTRDAIKFDTGKTELRKSKNRKALSSETSMKFSDVSTKASKISYSLQVFCKKFVQIIYNNYMQQIKHNLIQKRAQENDESYYLWAIQFFTHFCKSMKLNIDFISETLSTSTLHFIQILITSYQDKIKIEKKKFHDVSKRLHLAVRAYREILWLIKSVGTGSDFSKTVETIQRNIFTENEYSTLILNLFQQYDEPKHSEHYLRDLIQANDIFLDLWEEYSKTHGTIEVPDEEDDEDYDEGEGELKGNVENQGEGDREGEGRDEGAVRGGTENEESIQAKKRKKKKTKRKKKAADFRAAHFMSRYCHPDVIKAHLEVLKSFKTNEDSTNLAILRLFERIVYECKNDVILFQASIFRCLLDIMSYHSSFPCRERFVALGKHLMASFGSKANKRRWMFQELLFWKTCADVIEIENAIDPPAVPIFATDPELELEKDDAQLAAEYEEAVAPPMESVADLMAELDDDGDDDDDDGWDPERLVAERRESPLAPSLPQTYPSPPLLRSEDEAESRSKSSSRNHNDVVDDASSSSLSDFPDADEAEI